MPESLGSDPKPAANPTFNAQGDALDSMDLPAQTTADSLSQAVSQWTLAVTWRLFVRQFLIFTTAYLFIWGTLVLVLRVAMDMDRTPMLWGATGLIALVAMAGVVAYRKRPAPAAVQAMLDAHSQGGGLYMTNAKESGWGHRLPSLRLPAVKWRGGKQWLLTLASAAFVIAAFVMPQWVAQAGNAKPLDVTAQVATLNHQLETLKQESVLMPEQAQALSEKLKQVTADADGQDPVKTWESLDHIKAQVQDAAAQAMEKAAQESQTLDQAQMLAQALAQQPDALSAEQLARAMQTLEEMAQAAAEQNKKMQEMMKKEGMDPSAVKLTPEQLEALQQMMKMSKEDLEQLMQKLKQAGLGEKGEQGEKGEPGQGGQPGQTLTSEQVAQALAEMMEGKSVEEILEMLSQQGAGGVGRGGGPSEMTWNDNPSSSENTKFKDQVLPPAQLRALKESQRVGLSASAPKVEESSGDSAGGVLPTDKATGGAADQQILPRHREAVREFFDRQE